MQYYTSAQMAEKWGITKRRVNSLCQTGEIKGAYKDGYRWMIPESAMKPGSEMQKVGSGKKPLPIGITDYRMAVSEYYYVDKTLLIKDILDYRPLVSLFTRPRRFGKTLNMDMLRVFFENREEDTSIYFKNTNIWKAGERYRKEQGQYPVIFFTFKDVKYLTWEETRINLYSVIQAEYRRHLYLLNSDKLADIDKQYIDKVIQGVLEPALWAGTLERLSMYLELHYGVAPIVLIDEYDTPIQQGHMKGFYDDIIVFMRNFLSGGLKDNRHVSMAFLTGILRVAKESIFSGLNNLNTNSVLDNRYSEYFGFTEAEVKQLLTAYGQPSRLSDVKEWYDGYRFGKTEIYNPWSVLNYIDADFFPKTFWQSTGSNDIVGEIIGEATEEISLSLQSLLTGNSVEAYIDTSVVYPEVKRNPSSVYSFLLMAGYLTVKKEQALHDGNSICEVCIPNKEITILYEKEILSKLESVISTSTAISMQQALLTGNVMEFQKQLQNFLVSTMSYHDASAEGFYHGLLLGMSAVMNQYYDVTSNRESGDGRYDIQLRPKKKTYPAFLIEVKAATEKNINEKDTDAVLEILANQALQQIEGKNYCFDLKSGGFYKIVKIGIAFYKKTCKAVSKESNTETE